MTNANSKDITIGIVGGTGTMGSWFGDLLESQGMKVLRTGRRTPLTPRRMAEKSDVVVVSVPIPDTVRIIREIGPMVPVDGLLMDLTSIKSGPMEAMLDASRSEVVGMHPLLGPDRRPDSTLRAVICPGRGDRWQKWLTGVLQEGGLQVTVFSPQQHDRLMGFVQGVNHFSTLALAVCVQHSGCSLEEVQSGATVSFERRLERIRAITGQSAELFASLLMDNPQANRCMEQYMDTARSLLDICRRGDRDAFNEMIEGLKGYFGPA